MVAIPRIPLFMANEQCEHASWNLLMELRHPDTWESNLRAIDAMRACANAPRVFWLATGSSDPDVPRTILANPDKVDAGLDGVEIFKTCSLTIPELRSEAFWNISWARRFAYFRAVWRGTPAPF